MMQLVGREVPLGTPLLFCRDNQRFDSALSLHRTQANMLPDAYGCVVANRFGNLLDDEADPFDLISEVETEKEKDKKKKKKNDEEKGKQKRPGQRETQKDRRVPIASDQQDPVPGELHGFGCFVVKELHANGRCYRFQMG